MRKTFSLIGSAFWLVAAPGAVAVYIPWLMTGWARDSMNAVFDAPRIAGAALILAAGAGLLESFTRFALQGEGTPSPVMRTHKLVIRGLYRWVRNPMYVCVIGLIIGQYFLFDEISLLLYAAAVWLALHLYVVVFEEPRLQREFAAEYDEYRKNVRRWRPRLTPWRPEHIEKAPPGPHLYD